MKKKVSPSHGNNFDSWSAILFAVMCLSAGYVVVYDYRTQNRLGKFMEENSILGSPAFGATLDKLRTTADKNPLREQKTEEVTKNRDNVGATEEVEAVDAVEVTIIRERSELSHHLPKGFYILPSGREVVVTGHAPMHPLGLGTATDRFVKKVRGTAKGAHGLIDATEACNAPFPGEPKTYWLHLKPDKPRMLNICVWIKS